jgi:cyclic-di-GMP phosphodiesterase TipF (flagellum assembly factor)
LPRELPAHVSGMAVAAAFLAVGLSLHLVLLSRTRQGLIESDLDSLEERVQIIAEVQAQLRKDVGSRDKVAAEMRVLQKLLQQISEQRQATAAAPSKGVPVPAAAPLSDMAVLDIVRDALNSERVDLFLQPIVSLPQRRRRFYECFSRIRSADGKVIGPEQYLVVARKAGLMGAIDNLLLFRCIQLVRRARRSRTDVGFFCNIGGHSLVDASFFDDFLEFLGEHPDLAQGLMFEFSQADLLDDTGEYRKQIRKLNNLGYRFSLDRVTDLEIDYKDLAMLGFKYMKVDAGTLRQAVGGDAPKIDVGEFRLTLDRAGVDLIVEKIESETMLIETLEFKPDFGQGYLFGEPRLAAETP